MSPVNFRSATVGDELPPLVMPPVTRTMLALFAGASGDHNPIHIDLDFARRSGLPDVFAQGMLGMAWLGRLLTGWAPQSQLRKFNARFTGITHLGNAISLRGKVVKVMTIGDERAARLELRAVNQFDEVKITGEAVIALCGIDPSVS